jgi:hypothetical protein
MFAGRAHDVVLMDCLATEFQSPVLRDQLQQPQSGPCTTVAR